MKILFLDIDGVVNSADYAVSLPKGGMLGIDPDAATIVKQIIADTGCKVVLSSSWRNWPPGVDDVRAQVCDLYGMTPNHRGGFRGDEVQAWLDEHPEVTRYAILDDDGDFHAYQPLFRTTWQSGITGDIAKLVTDYLNCG